MVAPNSNFTYVLRIMESDNRCIVLIGKQKILHAIACFIIFIFVPAIGTISHESGHFIVGRLVGAKPILHYQSCTFSDISVFGNQNNENIFNRKTNSMLGGYDKQINSKINFKAFCVIAGGPIITIAIGAIGIVLIRVLSRRTISPNISCIISALALFWSREILIFWVSIFYKYVGISPKGDEIRCANLLGIKEFTIAGILGLIGFFACQYAIQKYPSKLRWPFITGAATGCLVGTWGWFFLVGHILLP